MPTPTDEQVDQVREVAGENDRDEVAARIAKLTEAAWSRALDLVDAWEAEFEPGAPAITVKDVYNPTGAGNDIRGRMRLLLGWPEFRDATITGAPMTQAVRIEWVF